MYPQPVQSRSPAGTPTHRARSSWCRLGAAAGIILTLCLAFTGAARAADTASPDVAGAEAMMKQLIDQVSGDLDKLYKAGNLQKAGSVETLIRADILPHVDDDRLTRRVFRQFWRQVVKAGRADDARNRVMQSLVRTYAAALKGYSGDTIKLVSVRQRGHGVVAMSRLRRPNGQTIQIDFNLAEAAGQWKINDMAVDGIVVSLTLFNAIKPVFEQQGLDAALNSLASTDAGGKSGTSAK